MLAHILFVFLGLVAVGAQPVATDCNQQSIFHVSQVSVNYEAPPLNSTLHVTYSVPIPVTDGMAQYSCLLNGFPVINEEAPLCQETACPITEGLHEDASSFQTGLASGTLSCTLKWLTTGSTVLRCIKIVEKSL
jgi:hypothetical protein